MFKMPKEKYDDKTKLVDGLQIVAHRFETDENEMYYILSDGSEVYEKTVSLLLEKPKVKLPKYIADKIEYCKYAEGYGLFHAMDYCFGYKDSAEWLEYNQETFARAWLDGYEVEKEKRYRVLIKDGLVLNRRLVKSPIANTFEFVIGSNLGILGIESFTKQELIDAGFGGVFDNEMFEIVEAEDD